jgi:hypothetical protein
MMSPKYPQKCPDFASINRFNLRSAQKLRSGRERVSYRHLFAVFFSVCWCSKQKKRQYSTIRILEAEGSEAAL